MHSVTAPTGPVRGRERPPRPIGLGAAVSTDGPLGRGQQPQHELPGRVAPPGQTGPPPATSVHRTAPASRRVYAVASGHRAIIGRRGRTLHPGYAKDREVTPSY